MKTPTILPWILVAALILPLVTAGSANAPELTDPAGDALGPVDVRAAWFEKVERPATTGVPEVDCRLNSGCREGTFRISVKVSDLLLAAPIADEDPLGTRYHYFIRFTPDSLGREIEVACRLNYLDVVASTTPLGANPDIMQVGRWCGLSPDGHFGRAFTVASSIDRVNNVLRVVLAPQDAHVGPGTTFSGLAVTTMVGGIQPGLPISTFASIADTSGPGASWTM